MRHTRGDIMAYIYECEHCKTDMPLQHMHWDKLICTECNKEVMNTLPDEFRDHLNLQYKDNKWYYIGSKSGRQTLESHVKKNRKRMFLGNEYIHTDNPIHTPGRYKNYNDLVFKEYYREKDIHEGEIYLVSNPAWPNWIKLGRAISAEDRLKAFKTASPFRDYKIEYKTTVPDAPSMEQTLHLNLKKKFKFKCEWFMMSVEDGRKAINEVLTNAENN